MLKYNSGVQKLWHPTNSSYNTIKKSNEENEMRKEQKGFLKNITSI